MWRLLEVGEVIEKGDEYYSVFSQAWVESENWRGKAKVKPPSKDIAAYRRKVAEPVKSSTPDPGDGYRLLIYGERIEIDDQFWNKHCGEWQRGSRLWIGDPFDSSFRPMRRKIQTAIEPVSVGDRVEVVSGTWANACGVVVDSLVDVRIEGFKMTALNDSYFRVKLDNVFVGGEPLTIRVFPSEVTALKSAPKASVQVDPEWRLLEIGEVLKPGDEVYTACWTPAVDSVNTPAGQCYRKNRRRVRIESPGWRYMDAGETVHAGDEVGSQIGEVCNWSACYGSIGRMVSEFPVGIFRRKTTPFAG